MLDMEDFVYEDRYARSEVYIDRDTQGVKQGAYLLQNFGQEVGPIAKDTSRVSSQKCKVPNSYNTKDTRAAPSCKSMLTHFLSSVL